MRSPPSPLPPPRFSPTTVSLPSRPPSLPWKSLSWSLPSPVCRLIVMLHYEDFEARGKNGCVVYCNKNQQKFVDGERSPLRHLTTRATLLPGRQVFRTRKKWLEIKYFDADDPP